MVRRRYRVEEMIHKLQEAEVAPAQGQATPVMCKNLRVTEQTFDRFRRDHNGSQAPAGPQA